MGIKIETMANAKLHMICGNCGSNDQFTYKIVPEVDDDTGEDYNVVSVSCNNCSTSHVLEDNAKEIKDNVKSKVCEHSYGEDGCKMQDLNYSCTPYPEDSEC